jgi:hypothetical protein
MKKWINRIGEDGLSSESASSTTATRSATTATRAVASRSTPVIAELRRARASLVNLQGAPFVFLAVQGFFGFFGFRRAGHFHEAKTFPLDNGDFFHLAVGTEQFRQFRAGDRVGKVSHIKFTVLHFFLLSTYLCSLQ